MPPLHRGDEDSPFERAVLWLRYIQACQLDWPGAHMPKSRLPKELTMALVEVCFTTCRRGSARAPGASWRWGSP